MTTNGDSVERTLRGDIWYLKPIHWTRHGEDAPRELKIITQNFNGPCSLISLCNILILRGKIEIQPADRRSVSYEYLSALLADSLVTEQTDPALSAALSTLPNTQRGMDLNPLFTSIDAFRPAGDGGELKLFELAGVQLFHGWLVDPSSQEFDVVSRISDYDSAVNAIVEADYISQGRVVDDTAGADTDFSHLENMSPEQQQKLHDALTIRHWLEATSSQMTYHGLFTLSSTLPPGSLAALFRNSHLSVLYKSATDDGALYALVTDHVFANEPSVVWERLEDVEGGASAFVDGFFNTSSPAGGDFAGATAEGALRAIEAREEDESSRADRELAMMLQREEDEHAQAVYQEARRRQQHEEQQRQGRPPEAPPPAQGQPIPRRPMKRKNSCLIM
ncbi:DUF544-domain-containing protein [Exidia glandulosa HHB12029]|uniref:DUF544-domain-containing protein n=1 Tax=Exidia glandulosa HHB12029 TaxID=1314781 RepID=A0A165L6Q2_EXIGL|nr:DUF544-domain-containing protein [Exidia glandulosa HHB12029]